MAEVDIREALAVNLARLKKASNLTEAQMAPYKKAFDDLKADTVRLASELFCQECFRNLVSRAFIDNVGGTKWAAEIFQAHTDLINKALFEKFSIEELENIYIRIDNKFQKELWKNPEYYTARKGGEMYVINPICPRRFPTDKLVIVNEKLRKEVSA